MTRNRWIVLALLAAGLVLVQAGGLDRQPETREEGRYRRIADLPASDMVPTYIASLFFGAFRAIVVDALWIQLKKVEDERRWYEMREILKLISYFQPRNPEVWSHLGWLSAYNVANGFTDPQKSWEWVKFGLQWLRQGNTMLPDSSYLKYELARTLCHKASVTDGMLDRPLLRRIEEDGELQDLLRLGPAGPRPLSAFELAIPWLERAREELFALKEKYVLSQSGLYVRPLTMDGLIRQCLYLQGMYAWELKRWEEAQAGFRRASAHTAAMVSKAYDEPMSTIFESWAKFYGRLPEIVELDRRARDGTAADSRALLEKIQALMAEFGALDEGFFVNLRTRNGRLDSLKQQAAQGRDPQEFNDTFELASELRAGALVLANLEPQGLDTDVYGLWVANPDPKAPAEALPPRPVALTLYVRRPEQAKLDLRVTVYDGSKRPIRSVEMRGDLQVEVPCERYGIHYARIEPLAPAGPWPANTSYTLRYETSN